MMNITPSFFLYIEQLSQAFHLAAIKEVATEVRIFPLLELGVKKSRHLETVIAHLQRKEYYAKIQRTAYEFQISGFQKGGNEMLIISSPAIAAR